MELSKQQNKHEVIISFCDKANEIFMLLTPQLQVKKTNRKAVDIFGISKEQLVGLSIDQLFPTAGLPKVKNTFNKVLESGESIQLEDLLLPAKFKNRKLRIVAFKMDNYLGLVCTDITDLSESIEQLDNFIYKLSHDFRGPISTMLGLVSIACSSEQTDEIDHVLSKLSSTLDNLEGLINNVIGTTTINRQKLIFEPINLEQVIEKKKTLFERSLKSQSITIQFQNASEAPFISDKNLISRIVYQVIENSNMYKQIGPGTIPQLNITLQDDLIGHKLSFADNGIGIAQHLQKDVFKMFFRGSRKSGYGLGLYEIKSAIRRLNGYITLESDEYQGMIIHCFLPRLKIE